MSLAPTVYYVLWIFSLILQPVIAYVMVRRKASKEFSFFFYFIVFESINSIANFAVYTWGHGITVAYSRVYWSCEAVGSLLGFLVIYEVFDNTFRPFAALRDFSRVIFRWATVLLVVVAVVMASSTHAAQNVSAAWRCILGILAIQRGVFLIQGGLLLFLLMYSSRLGMRWQQQSFGIALGLGFSASAHLILNSLQAQLGMAWLPMKDMLMIICDDMTIVLWAAYVLFPETARVTEQAQFEPKPILQRWNHVLSGGEEAVNGGTFIPSMERMVDRVMASQARQSYTELSAPSERRNNNSLIV